MLLYLPDKILEGDCESQQISNEASYKTQKTMVKICGKTFVNKHGLILFKFCLFYNLTLSYHSPYIHLILAIEGLYLNLWLENKLKRGLTWKIRPCGCYYLATSL